MGIVRWTVVELRYVHCYGDPATAMTFSDYALASSVPPSALTWRRWHCRQHQRNHHSLRTSEPIELLDVGDKVARSDLLDELVNGAQQLREAFQRRYLTLP